MHQPLLLRMLQAQGCLADEEEMQARFISGMDAALMILEAAVDRLKEARAAAVANDPKSAWAAYQTTMDVLRDFIEQSKKEPKF